MEVDTQQRTRSTDRSVIAVALFGFGWALFLAYRILAFADFDPSVTVHFGADSPQQLQYGQEQLGDFIVAPKPHDGFFFFAQANDPFLIDPGTHAAQLDRPTYRAQRMLYPMLAGGLGFLPPRATAWGLILVNVIAFGAGTMATAALAKRLGLNPWFGLAFPLNIGLIVELNIDGAGAVALAALMAGLLALYVDRPGWATVAMAASVLARETMALAVLGLVAYGIFVVRERGSLRLLTSLLPAAVWWAYVRLRIDDTVVQDTQAVDLPLRGFVKAAGEWLGSGDYLVDAVVGGLLLLLCAALLVRAVREPSRLVASVAGFTLLALVMSEPVWFRYFDSARALAPVFTIFILVVAASRRPVRG